MQIITRQLFDAVVKAATEVFENMFFVAIDPVADETPFPQQVVHAHIRYAGPHSATLHLYLPIDLARQLAADFLGEGAPDEQLVLDSCAEMANMIAGRHLKSLSLDARIYRLTIPQVAVELAPATGQETRTFSTGSHLLRLAQDVDP
jgi:CheY-specific phosphatase CheX